MNRLDGFLYRWVPSFGREQGRLHAAYVFVRSNLYAAHMRRLHRAGRHSRPRPGLDQRCTWCGQPTS
ncbi:hypothetical protein ACP4TB_28735 [Streptomyces sp. DR3-1]|uniref:hypothetical protein n=1 Tax=Streptomyces sp. DR3-1 TaxID=2951169 RepID=UPI0020447F4A|nr:hypothetical protein [Streptomyces sp. DR3-1]MCM3822257.1 hypothetical protein [Streptomyces sp. DR3-1]